MTKKHAKKLEDGHGPLLAQARKAAALWRRSSTTTAARSDQEQLTAIREWARKNGYQAPDPEGIKQEVVDAYSAAR